jgi:hypothetical protein
MKIEIKNVKFSEWASEETNCFACDIYADGKKIGMAKNDGRGGETNCYWLNLDTSEDFKKAKKYCKSLPPTIFEYDGKKIEIKSDLENVVDKLFDEWLKKKDNAKMEKDFNKGICVATSFGYEVFTFRLGKKQITLDKMKDNPNFMKLVKETCEKKKSEGMTILNTNLPFEI